MDILALGLRVTRRPILLTDTEPGEQVLEPVPTTGEARGVDRPVVGERGGGPAVGVTRRGERGHHVIAGDPAAGRAPEQEAGVVVEPGHDLDLGAIGELPVGEVGLPDLVGRRGLEPDPGAAWTLPWFGHDEPGGMEDAPDGRGRRDGQAVPLEVPGDGGGTRVETSRDKLPAQGGDPVADDAGGSLRAGVRPAGSWLEVVETAVPVADQEAVQVLTADPVLRRRGGDGQLRCDDLRGRPPDAWTWPGLSPMSRLTCRLSGVTYVLNSDKPWDAKLSAVPTANRTAPANQRRRLIRPRGHQ